MRVREESPRPGPAVVNVFEILDGDRNRYLAFDEAETFLGFA